jgi:hypothetical protein
MNGWAFLVAHGRRKGYRTVLAPDFLVEHNLHGLLSEYAVVDSSDASGRHAAEITNDEVGHLSLTFRAERLSSRDLYESTVTDADLVLDEYGRPLRFLYGIVAQHEPPNGIDEHDLRRVRAEALTSYRLFLEDEETFQVAASRSFELHGSSQPVQPKTDFPPSDGPSVAKIHTPDTEGDRSGATPSLPRATTGQRKISGAVVVLSGVAFIASLPFWFMPHPAAVNKTTCSATDTLTGTITAKSPVTVDYHWEWENGRGRNWQLTFEGAGEHTKPVTVDVPAETRGGVRAGKYTLVIDNSREMQQTVKPEASCGSTQ